jgi:multisubunit Na+/H+ antiporter MnhE subunit
MTGPLAGVGSPRRRERERGALSRLGSWLGWWAVLTGFWVGLDWSTDTAEVLVGVGVAAATALLVELVEYQTDTYVRLRVRWLLRAWRLPVEVLRDTGIVLAALWRRVVRGEQPTGGFIEVPTRWGEDSALGMSRRALLVGGTSVAPNTFALGMDRDRDVLVAHHLVLPPEAVDAMDDQGARR